MDEAFQWAGTLHDNPDLLPWVIFISVVILLFKERNLIRELITSAINARKETALYHAQHNELVRNNTAALENNTAALEMVKNEHDRLAIMIQHHEESSKERIDHIQTVVNRIDSTVTKNQHIMSLLEDRTEK